MLARLPVLMELKQRISDEWDKIDRQLIDSAIKQWRKQWPMTASAAWPVLLCFCTRRTHRAHALKQKSKLTNSLQQEFVNSV